MQEIRSSNPPVVAGICDTDVPFTELINENALSLTTNLSNVPLKVFLTVSVMSKLGLVLFIVKFIDERKLVLLIHIPGK